MKAEHGRLILRRLDSKLRAFNSRYRPEMNIDLDLNPAGFENFDGFELDLDFIQ